MKNTLYKVFPAILSISIMCLSSCSTKFEQNNTTLTPNMPPVQSNTALTRSHAKSRAARVSRVSYKFSLRLSAENKPFQGQTEIDFYLSDNTLPLKLDFLDGKILSVKSANQDITYSYNGTFISLPANSLKAGQNTLIIQYTNNYRRDGEGLHWFKDPEDGETYLHTQFEPWYFNRVFPGFDQPDIKASYQLKVSVPAHWAVISAKRETRIEASSESRNTWYFPTTKTFSTYAFSIHAGPYVIWEEKTTFRVPLRILARKSYAKYVDVDDWFKITRQGFDFFEQYFQTPYPYSKYDQLLVPELKSGAMENVGAVTFAEFFQPRRAKNPVDRERMSVVVQHELAHHWFGNLVTMRWWDDIWLNESFADLMGNYATSIATEHTNAMSRFSAGRKSWGYSEDQAITTHPIIQDVPDTDAVMTSLDGISYAKGAAVLWQLKHVIGEEAFKQSLANYFSIYANKNTSYLDLIKVIEDTSQRDLSAWVASWLKKEGVNTLKTELKCSNEKITQLNLKQLPANSSLEIREHKLDILLIAKDGSRKVIATHIDGEENKIHEATGLPCPSFVLPNVSDYTFTKILFDKNSIDYLQNHIGDFSSSVEKGMIWRNLFDTVKEGELATNRFIDMLLPQMQAEKKPATLKNLYFYFDRAYQQIAIRPALTSGEKQLQSKQLKQHYKNKISKIAQQEFNNNLGPIGNIWLRVWLATATPKDMPKLKQALLTNRLSPNHRWKIVRLLVRFDDQDANYWLDKLPQEDKSASSQLNRYVAEAQKNDLAVKEYWIKEAKKPESQYSNHQMRSIVGNLFPRDQYALRIQVKNLITQDLAQLAKSLEPQQLTQLIWAIPTECSKAAQAEALKLAKIDGLPQLSVKALKKLSQANEICKNMQDTLALTDTKI